jgi:prevent-host-death family protein
MKTMPAGEFKARCLSVMEQVKKYRTPVVITKKGRPVAKLVPADGPPADVFGCMAGTARITGDVEAPVLGAAQWEALGRNVAGRSMKPARPRRGAR